MQTGEKAEQQQERAKSGQNTMTQFGDLVASKASTISLSEKEEGAERWTDETHSSAPVPRQL